MATSTRNRSMPMTDPNDVNGIRVTPGEADVLRSLIDKVIVEDEHGTLPGGYSHCITDILCYHEDDRWGPVLRSMRDGRLPAFPWLVEMIRDASSFWQAHHAREVDDGLDPEDDDTGIQYVRTYASIEAKLDEAVGRDGSTDTPRDEIVATVELSARECRALVRAVDLVLMQYASVLARGGEQTPTLKVARDAIFDAAQDAGVEVTTIEVSA